MAKKKKKTAAKSKTSSRAVRSSAKKAPARRVSTASKAKRASSRRTTTKKKTAKKAPVAKKKTTRKSTASKAVVKKKPTAKKPTSTKTKSRTKTKTKSKTSSKSAATKKTAAKKATTKSAPVAKGGGKKKTASKTSDGAAPRKRRKPLGSQSVAEAASAAEADAQGYVFINGRRVRMISTGGRAAAPKPRNRKADVEAPAAEAPRKPTKTHLTAKELRTYRDILLIKRAELVGDLDALEKASLESGGASHLSNHMADVGSDTYDQDLMLGMAETERAQLREINEALERIANKTYGVCAHTGDPIPKTRLNAKPWARYTIEAARLMEGRGGG